MLFRGILVILCATSLLADDCASNFCEEDPSYPEELLETKELWKFDLSKRPKRSIEPTYLKEAKLCGSQISTVRPQKMQNDKGDWVTIVNHGNYTQLVRMELCTSVNFPCTFNLYPPNVKSFCQQKQTHVSLLALDKKLNCLVWNKFPIPSACDCMIDRSDLLKSVKNDLLKP